MVEQAQLAAIARQFGVDWHSGSANDRATLDRPGRMLPREEVLAPLRAALAGAGAVDGDIELPGFTAPMVAVDGNPQVAVEQLDNDSGKRPLHRGARRHVRWDAAVAPAGVRQFPGNGRTAGTRCRRLPPGSVVRPEDLATQRVRAPLARGEVVRLAEQAVGLAVRHQANPGQPLALAELIRPLLVAKGARVTMQLQAPGLSVSAVGQAIEGGGAGERIRVLNTTSRAVLEADVVGPDLVRIAPGTVPTVQPTGLPLRQASFNP